MSDRSIGSHPQPRSVPPAYDGTSARARVSGRDRSAMADATFLSGGPYRAAVRSREPGVLHGMREGRTWCGLSRMQVRASAGYWNPRGEGNCTDCLAVLERTGLPLVTPDVARQQRDALLAQWRARLQP